MKHRKKIKYQIVIHTNIRNLLDTLHLFPGCRKRNLQKLKLLSHDKFLLQESVWTFKGLRFLMFVIGSWKVFEFHLLGFDVEKFFDRPILGTISIVLSGGFMYMGLYWIHAQNNLFKRFIDNEQFVQ